MFVAEWFAEWRPVVYPNLSEATAMKRVLVAGMVVLAAACAKPEAKTEAVADSGREKQIAAAAPDSLDTQKVVLVCGPNPDKARVQGRALDIEKGVDRIRFVSRKKEALVDAGSDSVWFEPKTILNEPSKPWPFSTPMPKSRATAVSLPLKLEIDAGVSPTEEGYKFSYTVYFKCKSDSKPRKIDPEIVIW
ncbi:MAG: hypothetical protein WCK74_00035 [Gemmatimonadaceae bacterium]